MDIIQTVVGEIGGPIPGQMTYINDKLKGAVVQFLIVDNVPENCLDPDPDFFNNPIKGEIRRKNQWDLGNKLIVVYSPNCSC